MTSSDERPIMGNLYVYRLVSLPDGTRRVAVYKPRGNPTGKILYYEGVTIHDNGRSGAQWRGKFPFYSGGELRGETVVSAAPTNGTLFDRISTTIARTWGDLEQHGGHLITNPGDLDVPLYQPQDWED